MGESGQPTEEEVRRVHAENQALEDFLAALRVLSKPLVLEPWQQKALQKAVQGSSSQSKRDVRPRPKKEER